MTTQSNTNKKDMPLTSISEKAESQNNMYSSQKSYSINSSLRESEKAPIQVEVYSGDNLKKNSQTKGVRYVVDANQT